jgi:hypothetical protein
MDGSRLEALRFLERVQKRDLARTRRWIAAEERGIAEHRRGLQARPPAPDWLLEQGLNGHRPVYVHADDCWSTGKRSHAITRDQAVQALTDGRIDPCPQCRPDTTPGITG